jgi:hypothetical protein
MGALEEAAGSKRRQIPQSQRIHCKPRIAFNIPVRCSDKGRVD